MPRAQTVPALLFRRPLLAGLAAFAAAGPALAADVAVDDTPAYTLDVGDVTGKVGKPLVLRATLRPRDGYRILHHYNNRVGRLSSWDNGVAFDRATVLPEPDPDALVFLIPLRATAPGKHPINGVFRVGYIHDPDEMAMVSVRLIATVTGTE